MAETVLDIVFYALVAVAVTLAARVVGRSLWPRRPAAPTSCAFAAGSTLTVDGTEFAGGECSGPLAVTLRVAVNDDLVAPPLGACRNHIDAATAYFAARTLDRLKEDTQ